MKRLVPYIGIALAVAIGIALAPYIGWVVGIAVIVCGVGLVLWLAWNSWKSTSDRFEFLAGPVAIAFLIAFARRSLIAVYLALALLGALALWVLWILARAAWHRIAMRAQR